MPSINVSEETYAELQRRAARSGRSVEQEFEAVFWTGGLYAKYPRLRELDERTAKLPREEALTELTRAMDEMRASVPDIDGDDLLTFLEELKHTRAGSVARSR